ncbi:non-specific serine/threonine protein kinase [Entamoeba marina]
MEKQKETWGRLICSTKPFPSVELADDETIIGRSDHRFKINQETISKSHCHIYRQLNEKNKSENEKTLPLIEQQPRYIIIDTSTNGTYLNGEKLEKTTANVCTSLDDISLLRPIRDKDSITYMLIDHSFISAENKECGVFDKYDIQTRLGNGAMGIVRKAVNKTTNQKCAMKVLTIAEIDDKKKRQIERECEIMKQLDHINIVRFYEELTGKFNKYIFMELVEGADLFHIIFSNPPLKETFIKNVAKQILAAIQYLHSVDIIHRDLKPENIMISDKDYVVKLTDFGFGRKVDSTHRAGTLCGTDAYASPEIYKGHEYDGFKSDIWSCGVLFYVLTTKDYPFMDKTDTRPDTDMIQNIIKGKRIHSDTFENRSQTLKNFINSMLVLDPRERPTVEECLEHEFFSPPHALTQQPPSKYDVNK